MGRKQMDTVKAPSWYNTLVAETKRPRIARWNYRMTRRRLETGEYEFEIREIYYDANDNPISWCADPAHPSGETKEELMDDVSRMSMCIGTRVIDLDELEETLRVSRAAS